MSVFQLADFNNHRMKSSHKEHYSSYSYLVIFGICWDIPSENTGIRQYHQRCPVPATIWRVVLTGVKIIRVTSEISKLTRLLPNLYCQPSPTMTLILLWSSTKIARYGYKLMSSAPPLSRFTWVLESSTCTKVRRQCQHGDVLCMVSLIRSSLHAGFYNCLL